MILEGENNLYEVEKILSRRVNNGKLQYKIKWKNYPINQSTWEPMENLTTVKEMLEDFDIKLAQEEFDKKQKIIEMKKEKIIKLKEEEENEETKEDDSKEIGSEENKKVYYIDEGLIRVVKVKKTNGKLIAIVDKKEKNGQYEKVIQKYMCSTKELRVKNPWILIDFYESKMKILNKNDGGKSK